MVELLSSTGSSSFSGLLALKRAQHGCAVPETPLSYHCDRLAACVVGKKPERKSAKPSSLVQSARLGSPEVSRDFQSGSLTRKAAATHGWPKEEYIDPDCGECDYCSELVNAE